MSAITSEVKQVNANVLRHFVKISSKEKLAHAYLFIGPDSIGKSQTAVEIVKLINCENNADGSKEEACRACPSCLKIASGNHPDIFMINKGDTSSIKIGAIREVLQRMQLRPFEARLKAVIIKNIEDLTAEGSNALLKTLEEPTRGSLLILTTAVPEVCLSTVRSRCHPVYFFAMPRRELLETLEKKLLIDKEEAHFLSLYTEGCLGKAVQLHEEGFFQQKNVIIDNIIFNRNNEGYIKSLVMDKVQVKVVLEVLLSWFRDALLMKLGTKSEYLAHSDRPQDLHQVEVKYDFDDIRGIIQEIVNTKRLLNENLNIKIPLQLLREKIWVG